MRWVFAAFVLALPMAVRAEPPAGPSGDTSVCAQGAGEAAIAACSRIVADLTAVPSDRVEAYVKRGDAIYSKGEYDRAIADYDEAIRMKPDLAKAFNHRGLAYYANGQYDRAIADFDEAVRLKPDNGDALYNRGYTYYAEYKYDDAIADYDRVIRLQPDNTSALINRRMSYRKKGQYERAIADDDQATRLQPNDPDAFINRGIVYAAKGQYDRAIADYDQAIRLKPDLGKPYANRGIARWEDQGDGEGAVRDLERGRTLDQSLTYARAKLDEIKTSLARRAASHTPAAPGSRVALVIANGDYGPNALPNAVKDGEAIREALESLNYRFIPKYNISAAEMRKVIKQFGDVVAPAAETSLIWYVGHGVSPDVAEGARSKMSDLAARESDDFILGKDYRPGADPQQAGLFVSTLVDASQRRTLRMVVIDACRKLPTAAPGDRGAAFARTPQQPDHGQGGQANPINLLVVFSTQLGQSASDGTLQAGHSPFTAAFLSVVKSGDAKGVDPRSLFSGIKGVMREMSSDGLIEPQVPQVFDEQVTVRVPAFAALAPSPVRPLQARR